MAKYINADELLQEDFTDFWHNKADQKIFENILIEAPDANVVEVTHCKDCKHCSSYITWQGKEYCRCTFDDETINVAEPTHFCGYGKRREE